MFNSFGLESVQEYSSDLLPKNSTVEIMLKSKVKVNRESPWEISSLDEAHRAFWQYFAKLNTRKEMIDKEQDSEENG